MKIFILILIFIAVITASCQGNVNNAEVTSDTTTAADAAETAEIAETVDPRLTVADDIPEMDYNGYEFNILYPDWSNYQLGLYFAEDETGDRINDVLYARQRTVEERFNVVIKPIKIDTIDKIYPSVSQAVLAGDDVYDLALTHCISGLTELSTGNMILDFNKIDEFNFDKPWWNQRMNETLSVHGILLFAVSDFMIPEPNVIYFNKEIQENYNIEDMYSLVDTGKWTIDKFIELTKIPSSDTNGDGVFDTLDQYGLIVELDWMLISFMHSSEQYVVEQLPENPYPTLAMDTAKMQTLVEKVYTLLFDGNQTYTHLYSQNPWTADSDLFQSLFLIRSLSSAQSLRKVEVEFGILPFPKYDEAQGDYLNNSWNGFMCIPLVAGDTQRTAYIIEALSAESYRYFVPAYYDILLSSKLARDDQSQKMLDIIYNSCVYDSGLNFSAFNSMLYSIPKLMQEKSADYASFYAKNSASMVEQLTKVYQGIINNYS